MIFKRSVGKSSGRALRKSATTLIWLCLLLSLTLTHSLEDPTKTQVPPKTFVYVSAPSPDNGIYQFSQTSSGSLVPLKPSHVGINDAFDCVADPYGRFLYVAGNHLHRFRVDNDGGLAPLGPIISTETQAATPVITPDGRFLYLLHAHSGEELGNLPDAVIPYRIAADGTPHLIRGAATNPGPQPSALAVDRTGRFLYVVVYNYDLSGNLAYLRQYRINQNGTLTPLKPDRLGSGAAPEMLVADPSGPFLYLSSKSGISSWRIKPDGTLDFLHDESVFLRVTAFVMDPSDHLLIGIGEPTEESGFRHDQLVVWHQRADGTLTEPAGVFLAQSGFLYGDETAMPKDDNADPEGIALDADRRMLYVLEATTHRIFRYLVQPDGALRLQTPWYSSNIQTLNLFASQNPLFVVKVK